MKSKVLVAILAVTLSAVARGQGRGASLEPSKWQARIDLTPLLTDSGRLAKLVVIYRPSYRQTLFVFGTGQVVLQTYPPQTFNPDAVFLPTCKIDVSQTEIKELVRTVQTHLFGLPQREFAYTANQNSMTDFEKELQEHYIAIDDGTDRTYRAFAEGTYQHQNETIPLEFRVVEDPLRDLMNRVTSGSSCHMSSHYLDWTGRGEIVP